MTHKHDLESWRHNHSFGQERKRPGENRTLLVIAITGTMMIIEVAAGVVFGSMALLADGLHMASHAAALGINALAYVYARRQAHNPEYNFGTGKVNALGGFSGAVLLAMFSLLMAWESIVRLFQPVSIVFDQAIVVAVLGLLVNGASVFILGVQGHHHEHDEHQEHEHHHHHDHNLRSAYLHVIADALTSALAIVALVTAKYLGYIWMDPLMGIVGSILVARWSIGLLRSSSAVLLDRRGPKHIRRVIQDSIEADADCRITDLHVWSIGPSIYAAVIAVVGNNPGSPGDYKERLPKNLGLVHVSVEVHRTTIPVPVQNAAG